MPTYKHRTLGEFPQSFLSCPANPEGKPYNCVVCCDNFTSKSGLISHIKRCFNEQYDEDYDEDYEISDDGYTIGDSIMNNDIHIKLAKKYIETNELEQYCERTPEEIKNIISNDMVSRGHTQRFELRQWTFNIYRYFFEVTDDEINIEREAWIRQLVV